MHVPLNGKVLDRFIGPKFGKRYLLAKALKLSPSMISRATTEGLCRKTTDKIENILELTNEDREELEGRPADSTPPSPDALQLPSLDLPEHSYWVPFCINYRSSKDLKKKYYYDALASGEEVFCLSIMTQHSFPEIKENLDPKTKLTVLTWNPATVAEIIGCAKHEDSAFPRKKAKKADITVKVRQVQEALLEWDKLATRNRNIRVFTYDWMPAFKGTLWRDRSALIEFMTYDSKTLFRPALLLRKDDPDEKPVFEHFSEQFETILKHAKPRTRGERSSWFR